MNDIDIFQAALGLNTDRIVVKTEFRAEKKQLDIYLDFVPGTQFLCPLCRSLCPAYDTTERIWQHLNFFQYSTFIHARLPRIECPDHGVKQKNVPWARRYRSVEYFKLIIYMVVGKLSQLPT